MAKKHYLKHTKLYSVWNEMRNRCQNQNDRSYHRYGAKGISVCEEWQDFRNFYPWAINNGYKEGLTLDRINPLGNYEPQNCRWITIKEQQRNRSNNIRIEHDGLNLTLVEWCERLDFSYASARSRYFRAVWKGISPTFEDVFSKKNNYRNRRIAQYTLSGELVKIWDKMADARRAGYGGNITYCCQGKLSKTHGYVWRYYD